MEVTTPLNQLMSPGLKKSDLMFFIVITVPSEAVELQPIHDVKNVSKISSGVCMARWTFNCWILL